MLSIGEFAPLGQVSPRMLRHYDDLGLLRPERVGALTGYRAYGVGQLARLHKLLALRDLGFSLGQIGELLREEPPVEQLRGMLRLRYAQVEQTVAEEQARLRRVEAHLRALEGSDRVSIQDVVIKPTPPLRIAEATDIAPGFGPSLGLSFSRIMPTVLAHIERASATAGMMVAWYEEPSDDGSVVVHAGFEVGDQHIDSNDQVQVVELPVLEVASVVHHGAMDDVVPVYEALVRWIDDSGYRLAGRSRELYLEVHDDDFSRNITELQMPIAR
jgi:DNA-binding transcriptional MerR regulator/predicted transcriptional regulator YdeE